MRFIITLFILVISSTALAHGDKPHWEDMTPELKEWYGSLKRPDVPEYSCCGLADAYWADIVEVKDGQVIVTITDDRPDGPLGRPHRPVGTKIMVPADKMVNLNNGVNANKGNPTGHSILFIGRGEIVYCFVTGILS
jgi:hypothetical protein